MSKERVLTDLQKKFLEALFGEAQYDAVKAKELAGYDKTTPTTEIIRALKDEIIEQAKLVLAVNAPRAAGELVNIMINPNENGTQNKLKAVESILNRAGVADKQSSEDVNLKVPQGGLFIMPAKGASDYGTPERDVSLMKEEDKDDKE